MISIVTNCFHISIMLVLFWQPLSGWAARLLVFATLRHLLLTVDFSSWYNSINFTFSAIFQNRWNIIFIIIFINELSPSCLQWIYWTLCLFFFSLSWGKGVGSSRVSSNSGVFTIKLSSSFSLSLDDVSLLSNIFPWSSLSKSNNPMLCQHYEIVWPVDIFPFTLLYSVLYYLSKK